MGRFFESVFAMPAGAVWQRQRETPATGVQLRNNNSHLGTEVPP